MNAIIRSGVFQILERWCKIAAPELREDQDLKEIALDSVNMIEVELAIQSELGVTIEDDKIYDVKTVGDIVRLVAERSPAPSARAS